MVMKMNVKPATSFDEQVKKLNDCGCIISDFDSAKMVLQQINYYRFTAYLLPYKTENDCYQDGVRFNNIYHIHEFDRNLRHLIFSVIEEIELMLRTQLAYYHSRKYGPLGYLEIKNFNNRHKHAKFIQKIEHEIEHNSNQLFVKHHLRHYNGKFPLWVVVELFTMGELSLFYSDMLIEDKKIFALEQFKTTDKNLSSWLICLTNIRNYCAHYTRLYYSKMRSIPRTPKNFEPVLQDNVFDYLLILAFLYPRKEKWENAFAVPLAALLEKYKEYIDLDKLGLPINWYTILCGSHRL